MEGGTRTDPVKKLWRRLKKNQREQRVEQNYISNLCDEMDYSRSTLTKAAHHLVEELGVVRVDVRGSRKVLVVHDCLLG